MSSPHRILSMLKGRERFVLRYAVGMELAALQQIIALARDPHVEFDFTDAAILSYQLGQQGACGTGVPPVNPPVSPRPLQLDAHGRPLHVDPLYLEDCDGEVPPCA